VCHVPRSSCYQLAASKPNSTISICCRLLYSLSKLETVLLTKSHMTYFRASVRIMLDAVVAYSIAYIVYQKTSPFYFWNNSVKDKPVSIFFGTRTPEET